VFRPLLLPAFCAALLAGCAAPVGSGLPEPPTPTPALTPTPTPTSASPSLTPACPLDGFSVTSGGTDGALGLRAMAVELVNCGERTITLNGYPGLRLAGSDGKALTFALKQGVRAVAMIDEWDTPPGKVVVAPGQAATALLVWRGTTEDTPEGPQTATVLRVSAKDGLTYRPVEIANPIDLGTTGKLAVSSWRRDDQGDREVPGTAPALEPSAGPAPL
jgi:hypothetical protein